MKVIRPTGGFGTDCAILPGAAYKFVAVLNTARERFTGRPARRVSLRIIYRIYFAMPKIPENSSRRNICVKNLCGRRRIQWKSLANAPSAAIWTAAALKVHPQFITRSSSGAPGRDLK